jgi:uncharacterized delta-60 repeat protein
MLRSFRLSIAAFLFLFCSHSIHAQVGALQTDFGKDGYLNINLVDTIYTGIFFDSKIISDSKGNTYVSGMFDQTKRLILKLNPAGKPDLSFGNKGYLTILTALQQTSFGDVLFLQVDSDENIYLLGSIDNALYAFKYNRYGQADLSFGVTGKLALPVANAYAFSIDKNNNLYFSGGTQGYPYVVKFNRNGILDNTFGANGISNITFPSPAIGNPTVTDILIDSDGYLYMSAQYFNSASLVKLNPAGAFVNAFGTNGIVTLPYLWLSRKIAFDSEERIYILHSNTDSNTNEVYRYFTSGQPDLTFAQNGIFTISSAAHTNITLNNMCVDTNDNIVLSGIATVAPFSYECILVKINTTAMNYDPSFNSDGIMSFVYKNNIVGIGNLAVNTSGLIFAVGSPNSNDGNSYAETIIIDATGTIKGSVSNQKQNPNSSDNIGRILLHDGNLYVSGAVWKNSASYPALLSVTPNGALNAGFGNNGKKIFSPNINEYYIAIENSGAIYSAGVTYNDDPALSRSSLSKTDISGNRISSFGTNGTFTYPSNGSITIPFDILFDQDSSLLVFSNYTDGTSMLITKITRSGAIDVSYGNQGTLLITTSVALTGQKAVIDNNGAIYISGKAGTSDVFTTKITNQSIDPLFGIDGFFINTLPVFYPTFPTCSAVSFDSNNNLVLACYYGSGLNGPFSVLYKLTSTGAFVPEFGASGRVNLPYNNFAVQDLIVDKNDNIFLFGTTAPDAITYAVVRTNALGTVDASYGNNGLAIIASGGFADVVYDKEKGVAYICGNNKGNIGSVRFADIRIICLQIEKANFNTITGTVFADANVSCTKQQTESGIQTMNIVAQPGNNYSITDASGAYTINVDTGAYEYAVKQLLNPIQQQRYVNTCTDTYNISLTGSEKIVADVDFADKLNPVSCPLLYVDVQNTVRRRCYGGLTKIKYANYGTASESNVTVVVTYPEHNIPKTSTPVWQSKSNNTLTYNIGALNPGQEGFITIGDSVSCLSESILGLTQCIKVEITPVRNCIVPPMWDHSEIKIEQFCRTDSSVFFIKNIGAGDMDAPRNFNVFVNDTIIYSSSFLLESNTGLSISYPANGKSVRVSAEQHADFPFPSNPSLATQSCNATATVNPVRTALTNLPLDDRSFHIAYSCLPIIGSFDPNHKSVIPSGYGAENYINKKEKLTYTIQFQNVGTDTAFKVVIIDTLDNDLNMETLLVESSSHPFTYTLSGRGNPVLTFSFDPIVLTDSTSNLLKSQGFVSYSIYPKEDLSEGTTLSNKAYIFFDYNSPVLTNETLLTIKDAYLQDFSKGNTVSVRTGIVTANKTTAAKTIVVYPNPATDQLHVKSAYLNLKSIQFISITGSIVFTEKLSGNESIIKINTLSPGIYFYTITDESGNSTQGKVVIE